MNRKWVKTVMAVLLAVILFGSVFLPIMAMIIGR